MLLVHLVLQACKEPVVQAYQEHQEPAELQAFKEHQELAYQEPAEPRVQQARLALLVQLAIQDSQERLALLDLTGLQE